MEAAGGNACVLSSVNRELTIRAVLVPNPYLRVAYVCEFWLVLLCIHVVWPQAGGQGHLDIMGWYWKLSLPLFLSGGIVGMTVAAVSGENFWSRKTVAWLVLSVVLGLAMASVTYYYHLHENDGLEEGAPEETAVLAGAGRTGRTS
jgi:heme/copper-type cytochrome/quinol oxidase subunit 3